MKEPREIPKFAVTELRSDCGRYIITRNAIGDWECWCADGRGKVLAVAETQERAVAACVEYSEAMEERLMLRLVKPSKEAV